MVRREGEQGEGQSGEGRGEEEQGELRGGDEGVLEALLGGVVVEERGVVGPEHVAGGVVTAEVDGPGPDGGAEAEADDDLEDEERPEVELETFWCEIHRVGSAGMGELSGV